MASISARGSRVGMFIQAVRAPFLTASIVPVLVGAALAWRAGVFNGFYLAVVLLAMICVHLGLNVLNDYTDYRSGNDNRYPKISPFSGGSRMIQRGYLSPAQTLGLSLAFFAGGIAALLYLGFLRGWAPLWLVLLGLFLAVFYNAPPFRLSYVGHGLGELAVGLGFGPVIVLGTYYVQVQRLSWEALWAALPVGLLIAAVVVINEFPDYEADKAAHKHTLVVVLGRKRAVWGYIALLVGAYVTVAVGMVWRVLPVTAALFFVTLPLAVRCMRGVRQFHSDAGELIPTNAATIQLHLAGGLLLSLGTVIAGII